MWKTYLFRLGLCDEASDAVTATTSGAPGAAEQQGAAQQQEQAKEPGASNAPPAKAEEKPKEEASFLDSAKALFQGKPQLLAQNRALTTENGMLKAQLASTQQELAGVKGKLATLEGERAQLQALMEQAKAEKVTVDQAVTNELASQGVPAKSLPAAVAAGASSEETVDELREKLRAERNPGEAGKLVARIDALRAKQSEKKN